MSKERINAMMQREIANYTELNVKTVENVAEPSQGPVMDSDHIQAAQKTLQEGDSMIKESVKKGKDGN